LRVGKGRHFYGRPRAALSLATPLHWAIAAPANLRRQCLGVRRMLYAVEALLRNQRYEKKD